MAPRRCTWTVPRRAVIPWFRATEVTNKHCNRPYAAHVTASGTESKGGTRAPDGRRTPGILFSAQVERF
jgi:hypothetical protein